jgi:hypothetical protein
MDSWTQAPDHSNAPDRTDVVGLSAALKATVPDPSPLAPLVITSHALSARALHEL